MKTSKAGVEFIKKWEGCRLTAYYDGGGVLTIGYGHTSMAGLPAVTKGMRITQQQADAILVKDLAKYEADVNRLVKVPLTQAEFDTLVSFHFNTGALGKSTLLKKLNAGDKDGARKELSKWVNDNGQTVPGLVNRRSAEGVMWKHGGAVIVAGGAAAATWPAYIPYIAGAVAIIIIAYIGYKIWRKYVK